MDATWREAILRDGMMRIEQALDHALAEAELPGAPPRLAEALRYSVVPGGQRIRPRLCFAVARACGDDRPAATDAAAAAIELLHCASLVHDDLPCFDDADMRRGKATVHRAYNEPLAVLAGDALIVLAFETLARGTITVPRRLAPLIHIVGQAVGMPIGIVAGQGWESEPVINMSVYHRAKTGALFAAATMAGAAAAGAEHAPWRELGEKLGEAYQVADDIRDAVGKPEELGKPVGRDDALGRCSATRELGLPGAVARLKALLAGAMDSIPRCPGATELRALITLETSKFLPKELVRTAA